MFLVHRQLFKYRSEMKVQFWPQLRTSGAGGGSAAAPLAVHTSMSRL